MIFLLGNIFCFVSRCVSLYATHLHRGRLWGQGRGYERLHIRGRKSHRIWHQANSGINGTDLQLPAAAHQCNVPCCDRWACSFHIRWGSKQQEKRTKTIPTTRGRQWSGRVCWPSLLCVRVRCWALTVCWQSGWISAPTTHLSLRISLSVSLSSVSISFLPSSLSICLAPPPSPPHPPPPHSLFLSLCSLCRFCFSLSVSRFLLSVSPPPYTPPPHTHTHTRTHTLCFLSPTFPTNPLSEARNVRLLSRISGLSFDSALLSPLSFLFLVLVGACLGTTWYTACCFPSSFFLFCFLINTAFLIISF